MKQYNNARGFTFIELILYIALVTIVLSALVPFAWNIIGGGAKSTVQQEVYTQARYLSERIKREIRDAQAITSLSPTSITLSNATAASNPTTITFSGNQVTIAQGSPPPTPTPLHSQDTRVSSFAFTNYTSIDNKTKHIRFTFTLSNNASSNRQEYQESLTIESSAEIRSN